MQGADQTDGFFVRSLHAVFFRGGQLIEHQDKQPLQLRRLTESSGGIGLQDRREQHLEPAVLDERVEDIAAPVFGPPEDQGV